MSRLLLTLVSFLAATLAGSLVAFTILWQIAYAPPPDPPQADSVPGLSGPTDILWGESGDATIEAPDAIAATRGLGYVHGWKHAWSMMLWRQAARGRLGEWFGTKAFLADGLARSLGLAALAEESLAALPATDREHLKAYADGVSAAWKQPSTVMRQELLLLEYTPDPWLPEHTLAIERLFAFLSTEVDCAPVQELCQEIQALRRMIHVHGFDGSLAWVMKHDRATTVFQRHVYGSSALPAFQEVTVQLPGAELVRGATLIGTPYFVGGQSDRGSWAVLLASTAHLTHADWSPVPAVYERLRDYAGTEEISRTVRTTGRLLVAATGDSSGWVLSWPGLHPGSDVAAWRALPEGQHIPFNLFSGTQLITDQSGRWQVIGVPAVRLESSYGVLISQGAFAAQLLPPDSSWRNVLDWVRDTHSSAAARLLPALLAALKAPNVARSEEVDKALTYLVNWDYRYLPSSIGASIFSTWATAYEQRTGRPLHPSTGDAQQYAASLEQAVHILTTRYGSAIQQWRWEQINPERRFFAIAHAPKAAFMPRFAPLTWPARGHASTPSWGVPLNPAVHAAPSALEIWHTTRLEDEFVVRRRLAPKPGYFHRFAFLGRSPAVDDIPSGIMHVTALTR